MGAEAVVSAGEGRQSTRWSNRLASYAKAKGGSVFVARELIALLVERMDRILGALGACGELFETHHFAAGVKKTGD